ncbi:MAG TPA: hypothetical protein DCY75_10390 [Clostridiales bacterium]|nr:hypothetical protein [Clostridiales bacterium]
MYYLMLIVLSVFHNNPIPNKLETWLSIVFLWIFLETISLKQRKKVKKVSHIIKKTTIIN